MSDWLNEPGRFSGLSAETPTDCHLDRFSGLVSRPCRGILEAQCCNTMPRLLQVQVVLFLVMQVVEGRSFGLTNITERARTMGGQVRIHSSPGEGTRVEVIIPVR